MVHYPETALRGSKWARFTLLCFALSIAACAETSITEPDQRPSQQDAELTISANVVGTPIATLVVRVSAADIPLALVYNIVAVDGFASGLIRIPPGLTRLIEVEAVDATGQITHEGSAIVNVNPGSNPPLLIALVPRPGQLPITVTMAEFFVHVNPGAAHIAEVGGEVQLTASIMTGEGFEVSGIVEWASSNPAIASVDGNGMVAGLANGMASIVATFQGVAGYATVVVGSSDSEFQGMYTGTATVVLETGSVELIDGMGLVNCSLSNSPCDAQLNVTSSGPETLTYVLIINGNSFAAVAQPDHSPFVFTNQQFSYNDGVVEAECSAYMELQIGDADGDDVLDATGTAGFHCSDPDGGEIIAERVMTISVEK
jgi:hypothetical protein